MWWILTKLSLFIYTHTQTHTFIYTHIYIYTFIYYIFMSTHTCPYIYTNIYIIYTYMYIIYINIYITYMYIIYIYKYVCIHTHIHRHTYILQRQMIPKIFNKRKGYNDRNDLISWPFSSNINTSVLLYIMIKAVKQNSWQ